MSAARDGHWRVPATYPELARLQAQTEAFLGDAGIPSVVAQRILLALDELTANLVEHIPAVGLPDEFEVRLAVRSGTVQLSVVDGGPPFDPRNAPARAEAASLDDVPVGGVGLALVHQVCDSIDYERLDGRNRVRLVFARTAGGGLART